jgi:antitoxin ParD1/3/4
MELRIMNVPVPQEMQSFIEDQVKSGRYASIDDAVLAALAQFMQQDRLEHLSTEELEAIFPGFREAIAEGIASSAAGRVRDGEEFFAELEREELQREEQNQTSGRKTA